MTKTIMQKITPFLWFNHDSEEAAKFYTSIFRNSKIIDTAYYGNSAASGRPTGTVMIVRFELEGQLFMALNGGPVFKFSPAMSFLVSCGTQEEVDLEQAFRGSRRRSVWMVERQVWRVMADRS